MPDSVIPGAAQTGQQQTAASGVDLMAQLTAQVREADARAVAAAKAATVPISGGHRQPQNIVMPGAGRQYQQYALDNSEVTGKHQAKMQGIANLSRSVANIVGQVQQAHDAKKTQVLSVNIEHLMSAIDSADQAKQVLAQDPNNAAAKEQLEKANKIADEVLSDPKQRKAIAKAFNINFVEPSKNNTPEHAAMKQATESYAQQFTSKLPQQMAPNQQAIAQAQLAQAEAAATHKLIDAIAPAIIRAQSQQDTEKMKQEGADARETFKEDRADARNKATNETRESIAKWGYTGRIEAAKINKAGHVGAALIAADSRLKAIKERAQQVASKGIANMKPAEINSYIKDLVTEADKLPDRIQHLRDLREAKDVPKERVEIYNNAIASAEDTLKSMTSEVKAAREELQKRGGFNGEPKPKTAGADPTYIPDDDDDPDSYDN